MKEIGYVIYAIYLLVTIWLLANGLVQLYLLLQAGKIKKKVERSLLGSLPFVSVQVPVYNEKFVVEGLLDSLAKLDYPKHLFEILVLDDSTDETTSIIAKKLQRFEEEGYQVQHIRRQSRKGFKAGALQESLSICAGEFIAVFDADFRPEPSFLKQLLPYFNDEKNGLVQARWGHANKNQNFLTRIQSYLLDTYFTVEQAGRYKSDLLTNFCGTAGIWRKQSIVDAGGWDGAVLSEDLDISYRMQLVGWKIAYDNETVVPAELPSVMEAFKIQQARWTKGMAQVCRKNFLQVYRSSLPFSKKFYAAFHLSASLVFPCLFFNSLLCLPLLVLRHQYVGFIPLTKIAAIGGLNMILLTFVFYAGVRKLQKDPQFLLYFPVFLLVFMGLSVQNTVAVLQGFFGKSSAFVRTPKFAEHKANNTSYMPKHLTVVHVMEAVALVVFIGAILLSFYLGDWFYLLLFVLMSGGLGILIFHAPFRRNLFIRNSFPKISWR